MQNNSRKIFGIDFDSRTLTTLAMLSAMAFIVMVVGRVPIVSFLKYDPKDVFIVIGGLIYGPAAAALISLTVSFVEMITVSDTGPIGLIMNILSTCTFACTAAWLYKKKPSIKSAVVGMIIGCLIMSAVMVLWNYLITPLYMKVPRETVAAMLLPVFLPFNLIKGGLNSALVMLIYKPVMSILRRTHLVNASSGRGGYKLGVAAVSALALATFVLLALVLGGVI